MRRLALAFAILSFATSLLAEAQSSAKVFRIGVLGAYPPTSPIDAHVCEGFVQGLRDLGQLEGRDLVIEGRYSEGRADRLADLAAELVRLKVDVIVAGSGTQGALAAQRATTIDLKTAKALGLAIPSPALQRADTIFGQ